MLTWHIGTTPCIHTTEKRAGPHFSWRHRSGEGQWLPIHRGTYLWGPHMGHAHYTPGERGPTTKRNWAWASWRAASPPGMETAAPLIAEHYRGWCRQPSTLLEVSFPHSTGRLRNSLLLNRGWTLLRIFFLYVYLTVYISSFHIYVRTFTTLYVCTCCTVQKDLRTMPVPMFIYLKILMHIFLTFIYFLCYQYNCSRRKLALK